MQDWESIQVLSKLAITSEYFLQMTLDKTGKVLSSDSGLGPIPPFYDNTQRTLKFEDCFLAADWIKFENQRTKAFKSSHKCFMVDLRKIIYPAGTTVLTKWEFYFITEDFGTCLGLGHPMETLSTYNPDLGEFLDGNSHSHEVLDILLENKLLGFWEFDPKNQTRQVSRSLAQVLGYSPDELNNLNQISWHNHLRNEDLSEILQELNQHFNSVGDFSFRKEFRITTKNDQIIWVIGFGKTTLWDEAGLPIKMQGLMIDITEKRKQELWMLKQHDFLQDLAFQQSHSFRARLANILGILEILDTEQQTTESRNLLKILKKESKLLDQSLTKSIKESVDQNKSWEEGLDPE